MITSGKTFNHKGRKGTQSANKSEWFKDAVVNACADDYEDIVRIREDVARFAEVDGIAVTEEEIVYGLEAALAAGLIKCYELSWKAEDWRREVDLDIRRLVEFGQYFYVTDKGKEFLLTENPKEL